LPKPLVEILKDNSRKLKNLKMTTSSRHLKNSTRSWTITKVMKRNSRGTSILIIKKKIGLMLARDYSTNDDDDIIEML